MPTFPDSNFTFGGAQFRLLVPKLNLSAPRPFPQNNAIWTHIPYGANKRESDGTKLHTVWTPKGGIYVISSAHNATLEGLYLQGASLVTPWGTFTAYLDALDLEPHDEDGSYQGQATWSWA